MRTPDLLFVKKRLFSLSLSVDVLLSECLVLVRGRIYVRACVYSCIMTDTACATAAQSSSTQEGSNMVVLNDIHIDIMDYITPAHCTLLQFRYRHIFEFNGILLVLSLWRTCVKTHVLKDR